MRTHQSLNGLRAHRIGSTWPVDVSLASELLQNLHSIDDHVSIRHERVLIHHTAIQHIPTFPFDFTVTHNIHIDSPHELVNVGMPMHAGER